MAYNEEHCIGQLLEFLMREMAVYNEIKEVLVIASGCTDGTVSIVRRFAQKSRGIRLLEEDTRNGKAAAISVFLRAARFPICVLVNADTVPVSGAVRLLVEAFRNQRVGMVGGRPVPVGGGETRNGFWHFAGRVLWELHHWINMSEASPKVGEFVAFRRDLVPELRLGKTSTDEVLLEVHVNRSGYKLMYVPDAVVHLHTPQGLRDFIKRRRSIYCGHLTVAKNFGYVVPTMRNFRVARALLRRREFLWPPRHLLFTLGAVCLETYARILGRLDCMGGRDHSIWEIAMSTKSTLGWPNALTTSPGDEV